MAFQYTSWGRTRSPKNLTGVQADSGIVNGKVDVVLVGTLTDHSVEDGYPTQNQRYLHMLVSNNTANDSSAAARTVTVYGYNHAFARWFPLLAYLDLGEPAAAVALTAPDQNGAEQGNARKCQTFEIFGVDRVAFVGVTADVLCWAACSTF